MSNFKINLIKQICLVLAASKFVVGAIEENIESNSFEKVSLEQNGSTTISGGFAHMASSLVRIASFKLNQFGGSEKSSGDETLKIIATIVSRYELIALQDVVYIQPGKGHGVKHLVGQLNLRGEAVEARYRYLLSGRVGSKDGKEMFALIYRSDIFQVTRHMLYPDLKGSFTRRPHIIEAVIKGNGAKLVFINVHIAPKYVLKEVNALVSVHKWVQSKWGNENILMLGNFNTDCGYVSSKDKKAIKKILAESSLNILIPDGFGTLIGNSDCAYDRFISSGWYFHRNIVPDSSAVFKFNQVLGLDASLAGRVSDHYPIELSMFVDQNAALVYEDFPEFLNTSGTENKIYSVWIPLLLLLAFLLQ